MLTAIAGDIIHTTSKLHGQISVRNSTLRRSSARCCRAWIKHRCLRFASDGATRHGRPRTGSAGSRLSHDRRRPGRQDHRRARKITLYITQRRAMARQELCTDTVQVVCAGMFPHDDTGMFVRNLGMGAQADCALVTLIYSCDCSHADSPRGCLGRLQQEE